MSEQHFIITIGREFGSAGLNIGKAVAERLNVKCYDKELLTHAAKESGFCEEIFEHQDEKPTNSFLYSLVMDTYSISGYSSAPFLDMPLNHKVFLAQFDAIKAIADRESCVIVGRCADYALADRRDCINIFVHADEAFKANHVMERFPELHLNEQKAIELCKKKDKQRASYYNYYTSKKWGEARGYHMTLDSGKLGIEGCTEMILKLNEQFFAETK
ncbi:MAG: cytidylate kinase-like family protein [Lachnospiraceae bacterium]|nr:cytidylate kinase-like family protein [Lachnospiraceae bacterium]